MTIYKIIAVLLLSFLFNFLLHSQNAIENGNYSLSGSITYLYSHNTIQNESSDYSSKTNIFLFSPSVGLFFLDNLLVGGNIAFSYNQLKSELTYRNTIGNPNTIEIKNIRRHLSFGPYTRYYFANLKILPFIEAAYNYSNELTSEQYGHIFNFTGGINYFVSKSVALEPFIGYSISTYKNPDQDLNTFSIGIRLNYFVLMNE